MTFFADSIRDQGLDYLVANGESLHICSYEPTTYSEAIGAASLGSASITPPAPSDRAGGGREVIIPAITAGNVTGNDVAVFFAIVKNSATSELLVTGLLSAFLDVVNTKDFSLAAFAIGFPDPAGGLLSENVFGAGLDYLVTHGATLHICSQLPANYIEASSTHSVGSNAATVAVPSDRPAGGRECIVSAILDGTTTGNGTATHWAIVKTTATTELLAAGPLAAANAVVTDEGFDLDSFTVEYPDAVSLSTLTLADVPDAFTWGESGDNDEHITTSFISGDLYITDLVNQVDGSNNYTTTGAGISGRPGYRAAPYTQDGYLVPYTPIAIEAFDGESAPFTQYMQQATAMGATGEFYLASVQQDSRTAGERILWGQNLDDCVRLGQVDNQEYVEITIAGGTPVRVVAQDDLEPGVSVIEIWRDSSNDIYVLQNGVDVTDLTGGRPNISGTFDVGGFGGGTAAGGGAWDDNLYGIFGAGGLPSAGWRAFVRSYLRSRWRVAF